MLVQNRPGVLLRVAGLFARRAFNIESISVGTTQDPSVSRMTIVVAEDPHTIEQIPRQLDKLVNVLWVEVLDEESVSRELALIKVACEPASRANLMQMVSVFRANVVDVSPDSLIVECTGDVRKIAALLELLREFGIQEVARAGTVAMSRGSRSAAAPLKSETGEESPWPLCTTSLTGTSRR